MPCITDSAHLGKKTQLIKKVSVVKIIIFQIVKI